MIKGWELAELSATLDRLNICFSPINRPEDLFDQQREALAINLRKRGLDEDRLAAALDSRRN